MTFEAEENEFSILFYGWDDCNKRILSETINMDHLPRKEAKDDPDEDNQEKPSKKDLENAVHTHMKQ